MSPRFPFRTFVGLICIALVTEHLVARSWFSILYLRWLVRFRRLVWIWAIVFSTWWADCIRFGRTSRSSIFPNLVRSQLELFHLRLYSFSFTYKSISELLLLPYRAFPWYFSSSFQPMLLRNVCLQDPTYALQDLEHPLWQISHLLLLSSSCVPYLSLAPTSCLETWTRSPS